YVKFPGRFLLYGKVLAVNDDKAMVEKLLDRRYDLRETLIISDAGKLDRFYNRTVNGSVNLVSQKANSVTLEADSDNDAFLYVSDTYYPGWRAYVDGRRTKIYRANLAFRAVQVPKGKHTVVFKYVPMSFYIGLCLTCIGIVLCIFLWRRKDRDIRPEERSP
ncbi:MAG TPA: YfhO family protein, partial [Syntrophorhabdaceae bacterium]|nr:YfhO family protein [Syntrophorhabdaceae bacterium]